MHALVIGVDPPADRGESNVQTARASAVAMAELLAASGVTYPRCRVLLTEVASSVNVFRALNKIVADAEPDDAVTIFLFAQAVNSRKGLAFLVRRSRSPEAGAESVPITDFFRILDGCRSRAVAVFIDLWTTLPLEGRKSFRPEDLKPYFAKGSHRIGFTSCCHGGVSHVSRAIGFGVWTLELLLALNPYAAQNLSSAGPVTGPALAAHLSRTIQMRLDEEGDSHRDQRPVSFGSSRWVWPSRAALEASAAPGGFGRSNGATLNEVKPVVLAKNWRLQKVAGSAGLTKPADRLPKGAIRKVLAGELIKWRRRLRETHGVSQAATRGQIDEFGARIHAPDYTISLAVVRLRHAPGQYQMRIVVSDFRLFLLKDPHFNRCFSGAFSVLSIPLAGTAQPMWLLRRLASGDNPRIARVRAPKRDLCLIRFRQQRQCACLVGADSLRIRIPAGRPADFLTALDRFRGEPVFGALTMGALLTCQQPPWADKAERFAQA